MKRFYIFVFVIAIFNSIISQTTTNLNQNYGISSDGKYKWRATKVKVDYYNHCTDITFEIIALKPIRRLNIYSDNSRIEYGNGKGTALLKGDLLSNGKVEILTKTPTWGWDKVAYKETRTYTLRFGNTPPGATNISVYGLGVDADNSRITWRSTNITIDNPRMFHTNYVTENAVRAHLDANNDGMCGIYEVVGDNSKAKYACIKNNDKYSLIFISDNLNQTWWKIGDEKARLQSTATAGLFKAEWFLSDKYVEKDVYIGFDGASMSVTFNPGTSKAKELKFIKMYPVETPTYEKMGDVIELLENENYQAAIKTLSIIIDSKSTNNENRYYAYMLRAYAYRAMGLYKSAVVDYTGALTCKPNDEDAYYERGQLKLYLEDVTGIDDLKKSGEFGRALLREYDLLDYDTSKAIKKEQAPPLKKQSIPQLKKTNR